MGKPEDIPQDVWDAALGTYSEKLPASPIALVGFEAIARAIMAERAEVNRLREALLRIAFKDRHYRIMKPKEDGGFRGPGGMLAVWYLTGTNGSFVSDAALAEQFPALTAAIRGEGA